jgi:NADH:ubiquinone oxidoreductase subunit F (NADH-binding)
MLGSGAVIEMDTRRMVVAKRLSYFYMHESADNALCREGTGWFLCNVDRIQER